MPAFEVKIENLSAFQKNLKKAPELVEKYLQKGIEASAAEIHKNATKGVVPWKTGNLVQSFGVVIGRLYASVAPDRSTPAKYALYVHEGTAPHEIRPVNAKALFWPGAAHPVAKVNHPGNKPNRFIPKIIERSNSQIQKHFKSAIEIIVKKLAEV